MNQTRPQPNTAAPAAPNTAAPAAPNTSVIHGTHRLQYLIPALLTELRTADPDAYAALMAMPFSVIPAYVLDEGDSSDWWDSEEASFLLNDTLFDLLNNAAPEGCYFGAHPGDGSDFGYWEFE